MTQNSSAARRRRATAALTIFLWAISVLLTVTTTGGVFTLIPLMLSLLGMATLTKETWQNLPADQLTPDTKLKDQRIRKAFAGLIIVVFIGGIVLSSLPGLPPVAVTAAGYLFVEAAAAAAIWPAVAAAWTGKK